MRSLWALLLVLVSFSAFAVKVDRVDPDGFWGRRVGKVFSSLGECSGTLVAPRLVLTAQHCIKHSRGRLASSTDTSFHLGYDNGRSIVGVDSISVIDGWTPNADRKANPHTDWAILLLEEAAVSDRYDVSGIAPMGNFNSITSKQIVSIGYPANHDRYAANRFICNNLGAHKTLFLFDCNMSEGGSGSLIIGIVGNTTKIVGLFVASPLITEILDLGINVGVPAENFIPTFNQLARRYASDSSPLVNSRPTPQPQVTYSRPQPRQQTYVPQPRQQTYVAPQPSVDPHNNPYYYPPKPRVPGESDASRNEYLRRLEVVNQNNARIYAENVRVQRENAANGYYTPIPARPAQAQAPAGYVLVPAQPVRAVSGGGRRGRR